jgi:hypothetical protein
MQLVKIIAQMGLLSRTGRGAHLRVLTYNFFDFSADQPNPFNFMFAFTT